MKTAIKPNYFNEIANIKALNEAPKTDLEVIGVEQQSLANLSNHSGWKALKAYIGRIMEEFDELTQAQMAQGVSFEEIGRSTVVKEITKDALRRIISKVEDARDARDTDSEQRGTAVS